jgi:hypothetical protein
VSNFVPHKEYKDCSSNEDKLQNTHYSHARSW